jgi:hypothetical protein
MDEKTVQWVEHFGPNQNSAYGDPPWMSGVVSSVEWGVKEILGCILKMPAIGWLVLVLLL